VFYGVRSFAGSIVQHCLAKVLRADREHLRMPGAVAVRAELNLPDAFVTLQDPDTSERGSAGAEAKEKNR
jgi:hypothetical protein